MKVIVKRLPPQVRYPKSITRLEARCGAEVCGNLIVDENEIDTGGEEMERVLEISTIDVPSDFQRRGVATKLYETAARMACKKGLKLASTLRVKGANSIPFWDKQLAKGRAEVVKIDRGGRRHWDVIVLKQCPRRIDLSGARGRR